MNTSMSVGERNAVYRNFYARGLSCKQIAEQLGVKKNTVLWNLRRQGILRPSPGRALEARVLAWATDQGMRVEHMRGDWPYDALIDGVRVNIKSSSRNGRPAYKFALRHKEAANTTRLSQLYDVLWLVCLDTREIWTIETPFVDHITRSLSVPKDPTRSFYPLSLLGILPLDRKTDRWYNMVH